MKKNNFILISLLVILFSSQKITAQIVTFDIPDAINTYITCANDSNLMGGYYNDATGIHGFVYNGATIFPVNYPGAAQTYVYGINNTKKVVGTYNNNGNATTNEGFMYDMNTGVYTDITTSWISSLDFTIARDINDANCVVGDYKQSTTHTCFSMCSGTNSSFHYNYKPTYVNSINNTGRRAGYWIDGSLRHGLIYTSGTWTQVEFPGSNRTMMTSINDSNIAVGIFNLSRSFIYRNGVFREIKKTGATDIQVRDINNKGMVVGYYMDATNTYHGFHLNIWDILFRPYPNGFRFSNRRSNIWPSSWFNQFDYTYDPYLGGDAPFPKINYEDGIKRVIYRGFFPDWPLFVELMGEDQCYTTSGSFKVLKSKAFLKYLSQLGSWDGSCFGFVQASFMVWDSIQRFQAKFPDVGPFAGNLKTYNLPCTDVNRKCINYVFLTQNQSIRIAEYNDHYWAGPVQLLANLKREFIDKSKNERGLVLYNQNGEGGHIVNPYKILADTLDNNIEYVYIYDNNFPNDTTRKVTINKYLNSWFYDLATNAGGHPKQWGGPYAHYGIYLSLPVREYYNAMVMENYEKLQGLSSATLTPTISVYNSFDCDVVITNSAGQSAGFMGGKQLSTLAGAVPLFRLNGNEEPPRGYSLPDGNYSVQLKNFKTQGSGLTAFGESNTFQYSRTSAVLDQKDNISISNSGMTISNSDNLPKKVNLSSLFDDLGNEMNVEINNLGVSSNSFATIEVLNNTNEVKLINTGAAGTYDIAIRYVGSDGEARFKHDSISITSNTAHIISPNWSQLKTANVSIFVDQGNNNTLEDTLYYGNTEPSQILTYPVKFDKTTASSADTIHITNNGGGNMNWAVFSSDSTWLHISGPHSGNNSGAILISVDANSGAARSAQISIAAPSASNNPYQILVNQDGIVGLPSNVAATDGTFTNEIHLSWNAGSGATHYKVYRSDNAGTAGTAVSDWISQTSYTDTAVIKGQFYYYRLKAALSDSGLNATGFSMKDAGYTSCFTADFSYKGECAGQPTIFKDSTNSHSTSYCLWDINNDGTTDFIGSDIQFTFINPGTYTVKLTVTDSSSCTSVKTKTIQIHAFPQLSLFSDTVVCAGQSLTLNAGSGFDSYLWSTGAVTSSVTIDSTGFGLGPNPVYVNVTYGNTCKTLGLTNITWDTCVSAGGFNLAGNVTYDNISSTPLNGVTVRLMQNGIAIYSTITDVQGHYSFSNISPGSYIVAPLSVKAWGGVNSTDALKVLRHFTALTLLEGIRLTAADVNGANGVNSVDALLMVKRFVSLINFFNVGDWAFEQPFLVAAGSGSQTINIKGVAYGDVDGSYVPPNN